MDRESQRRFNEIELRFSKHEEQLFKHDKQLHAIRTLLHGGMQLLVKLESKVNALTDSQIRLYGTVQELAEAQKQTETSLRRMEDAVKKFLDRSGNGHRPK
jgi:chromosome segregation ATPase